MFEYLIYLYRWHTEVHRISEKNKHHKSLNLQRVLSFTEFKEQKAFETAAYKRIRELNRARHVQLKGLVVRPTNHMQLAQTKRNAKFQ